jgi:Ca-activated chloride channel family protein
MLFGHIHFVYLFWLVIGLFLFFLLTQQRRKQAWESFAQKELLPHLLPDLDIRKMGLKASFLFIALGFCVLALMKPQAGFRWEAGKRLGLDILIAIDTSKSMLAEDLKPCRLDRAKGMVKEFVRNLRGDRIGLIAFSGTAFLVCPLTVDYNAFLLFLDSIDGQTIPKGGTSISLAIKEALRSYREAATPYKALVLLTDGEDHEGDLLGEVELAKQNGLRIFCIGLGTREGELIPVVDETGKRDFLKDREGRVVKTTINDALLQKIALGTGGNYLRADEKKNGLHWIYEEKLSKMEKGEFEGKMKKHYREWYQVPLFMAFVLLVLEPMISGKKEKVKRKK